MPDVQQSGQSDNSQLLMTTTAMTTQGQGRTLKALRADNVTVWVPQNRLRIMKAKGGSVESYFRTQSLGGAEGALGSSLQREGSQDAPMYARISRRHSPLRSLSYTADSTDINGHNPVKKNTPVARRHLERQKTINESVESINHIRDPSSSEYTDVKSPPGSSQKPPVWAEESISTCQQSGFFHNSPYGTTSSSTHRLTVENNMQNHVEHLLPPSPFCRSNRQRSTSAGNVYETVQSTAPSNANDSNNKSGNQHNCGTDNLLPDTYITRRARSVSPRATGARTVRDTTTYRERLKDSSSQVDIQHTHFYRNIPMVSFEPFSRFKAF